MIQDTSINAFDTEIRPILSERHAEVRVLLLRYPDGLTNAEIGYKLRWTINRVTPRVPELRELGAVRDAGKRTCRITGHTAHVWKLTYHDISKVERTKVKQQLQLI